jgi:hypothetical protein
MATPTKQELTDRLTPKHLDPEEMKKRIEAEVVKATDPIPVMPPTSGGKLEREYTWQFSWTDGRGRTWSGQFRNKVLSVRDRQMVGILRARLAAGVPLEALDDMTAEVNLMIAHLTYSLAERPAWAKDLAALDDVRLLQEIYLEVADHEATFFGYRPASPAGEGGA